MLVQYEENKGFFNLSVFLIENMYLYISIHMQGAPYPHLSVISQREAAVHRQKASLLYSGKIRHSQGLHIHGDV